MTQAELFPLSPNHLNSARELSTGWLPRRGTNGGISQRRKQLAGAVSSEPRFFLKAPPPAGRGSHTRCALVGPPLPQTHVTSALKTASLPGHTARGAVVYRAGQVRYPYWVPIRNAHTRQNPDSGVSKSASIPHLNFRNSLRTKTVSYCLFLSSPHKHF